MSVWGDVSVVFVCLLYDWRRSLRLVVVVPRPSVSLGSLRKNSKSRAVVAEAAPSAR